jgi:hypothetical protein
MAQVCILGFQLPLVRHVDQQIETGAIGITIHNRSKLLIVKDYQCLDGVAKFLQKVLFFVAVCDSSARYRFGHKALSKAIAMPRFCERMRFPRNGTT